jgi:flavin reductase (DIM6/NTAB) family NADH-FMN oxidoreductase RutF
VPSTTVGAPRLAAARVALECQFLDEKELYDSHVVFGEVVVAHVHDAILGADDRIDPTLYRPVGRLGGSSYTTVSTAYAHPVPVATPEWLASQPGAQVASP